MDSLVDRFLEHLVVEHGLAQNSLEAYRRDLARYSAYLKGRRKRVTALDRAEVPRYLL
ncbi:MAG: site-specific integrase, partial [candidate division NC10 bacterium]|nr:site-specific integrase [candidate division NC10 bacterium]